MSAAAGGPPRLGRAPWTTAGDLDAAQRGLVDRIRDDWGGGSLGVSPFDSGGRLVGPFDLMAASPHVGAAVLEAAASFRDSDLAVVERELVILVVAVAERAGFMWAGHRPVALAAGLSPRRPSAFARARCPGSASRCAPSIAWPAASSTKATSTTPRSTTPSTGSAGDGCRRSSG